MSTPVFRTNRGYPVHGSPWTSSSQLVPHVVFPLSTRVRPVETDKSYAGISRVGHPIYVGLIVHIIEMTFLAPDLPLAHVQYVLPRSPVSVYNQRIERR